MSGKIVYNAISWIRYITDIVTLYNKIHYIGIDQYAIGALHPALTRRVNTTTNRDDARLPVKLKLMTITYLLHSTRAAFNQNH